MVGSIAGYVLAFVVGLVLGALHFGGLWLTVQRVSSVENPALLVFASMLGRMALVGLGFYLVASGSMPRLFAALAGLLVARTILVTQIGSANKEAGTDESKS